MLKKWNFFSFSLSFSHLSLWTTLFSVECWSLFSLGKPNSFSPPPTTSFLQAPHTPPPPSNNDPHPQTTDRGASTPPRRILFHSLTPPSCPCSRTRTRCRNSRPSLSRVVLRLFLHKDSHSFFLLLIALSGYLEGFLLNLGKDEVEKSFPQFSVQMTKRFDFALEYLTPIIAGSIPNNKQFVYFSLLLFIHHHLPFLIHSLYLFLSHGVFLLLCCFFHVLSILVGEKHLWLRFMVANVNDG